MPRHTETPATARALWSLRAGSIASPGAADWLALLAWEAVAVETLLQHPLDSALGRRRMQKTFFDIQQTA